MDLSKGLLKLGIVPAPNYCHLCANFDANLINLICPCIICIPLISAHSCACLYMSYTFFVFATITPPGSALQVSTPIL